LDFFGGLGMKRKKGERKKEFVFGCVGILFGVFGNEHQRKYHRLKKRSCFFVSFFIVFVFLLQRKTERQRKEGFVNTLYLERRGGEKNEREYTNYRKGIWLIFQNQDVGSMR